MSKIRKLKINYSEIILLLADPLDIKYQIPSKFENHIEITSENRVNLTFIQKMLFPLFLFGIKSSMILPTYPIFLKNKKKQGYQIYFLSTKKHEKNRNKRLTWVNKELFFKRKLGNIDKKCFKIKKRSNYKRIK